MRIPYHLKEVVIAFVLVLAFANNARGDSRLQARRHFRRGMELIFAGKHEKGIEALQRAYAIKPHPNVLFNIGRAYMELGHVRDALVYYKRYLESDPPDATTIAATVAKIEESLAPPTPPPTTPPSRRPVESEEKDQESDTQENEQMVKLIERLEKAVLKAEGSTSSAPKQKESRQGVDAKLKPTILQPSAKEGAIEDSKNTEHLSAYEQLVVSASKRIQSPLDAPAATSVITAEEIRQSGAQSIPEMLRYVPGADVMFMGVRSANISFRGFNTRSANKVLTLVDGRSIYEDYLGFTHWPGITLSIDDVERIEIVRGPGSTLYGANAFVGVVNIITKKPGSAPAASARLTLGTGRTIETTAASSGKTGALRYRLSLGFDRANKWSIDFDENDYDIVSNVEDPTLGQHRFHGSIAADYIFAPTKTIEVAVGVSEAKTEYFAPDALRNFRVDGTKLFLKLDGKFDNFKIRSFWNHSDLSAVNQFGYEGVPNLDSDIMADIVDVEFQYDNSFNFLGKNNFVAGIGWRLKRVDWNFLLSTTIETHFSAFVQDEWRPWNSLILTGSYRLDIHPLLDNGNPGPAHSPRASIVYKLTPYQSLRVTVSTAFRVPTFSESYLNVSIPVPGVDGAVLRYEGDRKVSPEHIVNTELGYMAELDYVTIDASLYRATVTDCMGQSDYIQLPAPTYDETYGRHRFRISRTENNTAIITALGGELGTKVNLIDRLDLRANFSLEKLRSSDQESVCYECQQTPQVRLFGAVIAQLAPRLHLSVDATYYGETSWLAETASQSSSSLTVRTSLPLPAYTVVNAQLSFLVADGKMRLAISGTNLAVPHKEHPFGNRIDRRVFVTLGGDL